MLTERLGIQVEQKKIRHLGLEFVVPMENLEGDGEKRVNE